MADLTSVRNPAVVAARRLARARNRDDDRMLVESPGPVAAAVAAGALVELFVLDEAADAHADVVAAARAAGASVRTVTAAVLEAAAATRSPQGLVGTARWPLAAPDVALTGSTLAVIAVECADPGNAGTIVRTADAAGADAVVFVDGTDPRGPKAVRASAGSLFHLPVAAGGWPAARDAARAAGLTLVAADAGAARAYHRHDWRAPAAVVLGSEAHGLRPEALAECDEAVALPLHGAAESLNVAVTGAVLVYEAARQRADQTAPLAGERS